MTKGIVGIQNIFGAGGIGQSAMIDLEMYRKASETVASDYVEGKIMVASIQSANPMYVSTDVGANWSAKGGSTRYDSIAISEDGKYVLACIQGGKVILYNTVTNSFVITIDVNADWRSVCMSKNGQYMMACSNASLYISNDYGANWSNIQSGNFQGVAISDNGQYMVAHKYQSTSPYPGVLYYSNDYGANWSSDSEQYRTIRYDRLYITPDGSKIYYVNNGYDNRTLIRYTNGLATKVTLATATNMEGRIGISADGTKIAYTRYGGQILVSINSGGSFTARDSNRNWGGIDISIDGNYAIAIVPGASGNIYYSSDLATFNAVGSKTWYDMDISESGKYMIGTSNNDGLYISSNYGATWSKMYDAIKAWYLIKMSKKRS